MKVYNCADDPDRSARVLADGDKLILPKADVVRLPLVCCDCGLAHVVELEIDQTGRIHFSATRSEELTDLRLNELPDGMTENVLPKSTNEY